LAPCFPISRCRAAWTAQPNIGCQPERTGGDHPDNIGEPLHSRPRRPSGRDKHKNASAGDREYERQQPEILKRGQHRSGENGKRDSELSPACANRIGQQRDGT
jgi:hypothetical protein